VEIMTEVHDSPSGWVNDHIQQYVSSDGAEGHLWNGVPTLLLTTKGRKTGELRRTALIYGRHGSSYLVVASQGGAPSHPAWYLNLEANPEVQVQVGAEKFIARARTASEQEKPELWRTMTGIWPAYDEYQTKTDRPIPVVVLDPS
jgi:deazaflavin-dependent oxidoreductase (nitroreductase family)